MIFTGLVFQEDCDILEHCLCSIAPPNTFCSVKIFDHNLFYNWYCSDAKIQLCKNRLGLYRWEEFLHSAGPWRCLNREVKETTFSVTVTKFTSMSGYLLLYVFFRRRLYSLYDQACGFRGNIMNKMTLALIYPFTCMNRDSLTSLMRQDNTPPPVLTDFL